uniref:Uncharacterized protein n=1 Tax=Mola mola TaxID=94237 RepID=A0A3Q3WXZ6_MOLML
PWDRNEVVTILSTDPDGDRVLARDIHIGVKNLNECHTCSSVRLPDVWLQDFQRDSDELLLWMDEKFKVAEDESYRDPTNILRKLKKHEAAEREMKANEVRLDRLEGEEMLSAHGSADGKVRPRLGELTDSWDALIHGCQEKKSRLLEAYQVQSLLRVTASGFTCGLIAFSCSS